MNNSLAPLAKQGAFLARFSSLPHLFCAMVLLSLLSACALASEQSGAARVDTAPRPIGVSDNASPDDRGREILRVVIELIKHGDLLDTEFSSKLLRLPITAGKGF